MKHNLVKVFVFTIILVIAGFFRFYQLGNVPPSPDWDEAALGYNAYSILKTGRDEYGTFLPLSIRSFDDYKPPLYTYLTVFSVGLFGLNTWSTRLPSAVMGMLAVVGTYFLVKELLRTRTQPLVQKQQVALDVLPFVSSFLLAISPWHIQFSRIAFEANIGITLNIWAVTCFLAGFRRKPLFFVSAFLFGLGLYAYHTERVFVPLLCLLLLWIYRKTVFARSFRICLGIWIGIGILTVAPLISVFTNSTAMLRLQGTSSFSNQTELLSRTIQKLEDDQTRRDTLGLLLDNRRFVYVKTIVAGYLSHFSFNWLFLTGDNPRHHAPDVGLLYLWELPFLLYGLYVLVKVRSQYPCGVQLIIGWVLISPIAASVTTGLPHAIRTLVFLPTFQIITATGIVHIVCDIQKRAARRKIIWYLIIAGYSLFIVLNILYYGIQYFVVMNKEYSQHWQYGYKEAVAYTESVKDAYQTIVVSTGLEQSYMFFLFYTAYDPALYLMHGGTKSGSFAEQQNQFDVYKFRPLDWEHEQFDGKTLYVGSPSEIPHGNNAHITFLDGSAAIEIKDRKD